jgi:hypothetical protein
MFNVDPDDGVTDEIAVFGSMPTRASGGGARKATQARRRAAAKSGRALRKAGKGFNAKRAAKKAGIGQFRAKAGTRRAGAARAAKRRARKR